MSLPELRAIIVDDEAPAREILQELLLQHPKVKVIGEADSVKNAIMLCRDLQPNLVFLDIQLDDEIGFELLPQLGQVPAVIFVTAHAEFAIRAFEVNAIDYLTKPVNPERLASALERITHRPQPVFSEKLVESDQIYLESSTSRRMVYLTEISGIVADGNYTLVHHRDGAVVQIRRTLNDWDAALPKQYFVRLHRSLIINFKEIKTVSVTRFRQTEVVVAGFDKPLRLGWRASARLREAFRQHNLL